ncbi:MULTISPECIES: DUF6809 family protein [Paenibacillus]|uniref:Uncharacterized protein n=1 Tax=Paenibacillus pabuli TaxID=1472 RepID=A0A855Y2L3_9BACL|nr:MULTISPECIES: DUF6809 family protein [Paenibacillus]PWW42998.1 hypothetical protein DET56_10338 [Paenibacillus pabuli]PXW08906.1 hypothetical protein DEU73_10338 [Paenibacillus taichungensis]
MNSILEALYNGRLRPDETMMPTHPEYQMLGQQISAKTEQWKNRLSEEEFGELEQLFDLCGQCDGMHSEAAFVQGFRIGANMLIEVMSQREESVPANSANCSVGMI